MCWGWVHGWSRAIAFVEEHRGGMGGEEIEREWSVSVVDLSFLCIASLNSFAFPLVFLCRLALYYIHIVLFKEYHCKVHAGCLICDVHHIPISAYSFTFLFLYILSLLLYDEFLRIYIFVENVIKINYSLFPNTFF